MEQLVPVVKHAVVAGTLTLWIRASFSQFQCFTQNSLQFLLYCSRVSCPSGDIVVEKNFTVQAMAGPPAYRSRAYLQFPRINLQDDGSGIRNQHAERIPDGFAGWALE